MLVLEGIPLFLIELGMGQRMRLGALGVWTTIHPWLGGIGISSCIVTLFVAIYYNVIITWCIYYFINSFRVSFAIFKWESINLLINSLVSTSLGNMSSGWRHIQYFRRRMLKVIGNRVLLVSRNSRCITKLGRQRRFQVVDYSLPHLGMDDSFFHCDERNSELRQGCVLHIAIPLCCVDNILRARHNSAGCWCWHLAHARAKGGNAS